MFVGRTGLFVNPKAVKLSVCGSLSDFHIHNSIKNSSYSILKTIILHGP